MKFSITALIDEDTRKQLRDVLLGQVKGLTRELLTETILDEIRRKLDNALPSDKWYWQTHIQQQLVEVLKKVVGSQWDSIGAVITKAAKESVEKVVADKMANKVFWEAQQQRDFIREIVREEMRNHLKSLFGKD
jgi:uncharacterized membrane protein YheB (UPF0754 family)